MRPQYSLSKPLGTHTKFSNGRCPRWLTLDICYYILGLTRSRTSTWGYNLRIAVLRQIPRCDLLIVSSAHGGGNPKSLSQLETFFSQNKNKLIAKNSNFGGDNRTIFSIK